MAGKQAKTITQNQLKAVLAYVSLRRNSERNRVMVLLSHHCALRACEIAGVSWRAVMNSDGGIGNQLALEDRIAKMGSGRTIPLSPDLRAALISLHDICPARSPDDNIIRSERGKSMSAASVVQFFFHLYKSLCIDASSHSGRRGFITNGARKIGSVGGSLRDIQYLAGHSSLTTTARYIETDNEAAKKLVNLL